MHTVRLSPNSWASSVAKDQRCFGKRVRRVCWFRHCSKHLRPWASLAGNGALGRFFIGRPHFIRLLLTTYRIAPGETYFIQACRKVTLNSSVSSGLIHRSVDYCSTIIWLNSLAWSGIQLMSLVFHYRCQDEYSWSYIGNIHLPRKDVCRKTVENGDIKKWQ